MYFPAPAHGAGMHSVQVAISTYNKEIASLPWSRYVAQRRHTRPAVTRDDISVLKLKSREPTLEQPEKFRIYSIAADKMWSEGESADRISA